MPRTPSMTQEEAEKWLGPNAAFIISSENAKVVRKWLTAIGIPAGTAYALSKAELANLYHSGAVEARAWFLANASRTQPSAATPASGPRRAGVPMPGAMAPAVGAAPASDDAAEKLRQAIEAMRVESARHADTFDPDQIRAIAREEIELKRDVLHADVAAMIKDALVRHVKPIEVTSPRGTVRIEGTTHYATERVLKTVALGHPVMMVGPAGCGKTTIGENVASALNLPFYITSTVNETHEILGFKDGYGNYHATAFRNAFENGGIWVADEIDAWEAAALLAANSALANGYVTFPDRAAPVARHPDFRMIATANTFGNGADRVYIGRNELDAASLDRFAMIVVDYDMTLETQFAGTMTRWLQHVWKVRKLVNEKKIRHVVSSRAIIFGAQALAAGFSWEETEDQYLFKGMSKIDRDKLAL